jgi:hypothetical protein
MQIHDKVEVMKQFIAKNKADVVAQYEGELGVARDELRNLVKLASSTNMKLHDEARDVAEKTSRRIQSKFLEQEQIQEGYKDKMTSMLKKIGRFNSDLDVEVAKITDTLDKFRGQLSDQGEQYNRVTDIVVSQLEQ